MDANIIDAAALHREIDSCMGCDQHRLRNRLKRLSKSSAGKAPADAEALEKLVRNIKESAARKASRLSGLPQPQFPSELPIVQHREAIIESIRKHAVTIICGETGSGKTTQIPKMCLQAGLGINGLIGHTQPRRLAARSVSSRIASELNSEVGGVVGYKVRFSDQVSSSSYIKLMTDGILLAEIQSDPWLNQYDTLIIDEAHERSLNIDFILGYLKRLLQKRRDLKIIITSATIDPGTFSKHFDDAPVILAQGRSYPVEVRYRPWGEDDEDERDQAQAIFEACDELASTGPGDILVFLPGERDIREAADHVAKASSSSRLLRGVEVVPLLARLSAAEQAKIFQSHSARRIVLATNVAETSLTVPGIRFVVDTGMARVSRYSVRSKVQRLPIEKVSQASADQRKGRCGREAPGICVRLFAEDDFNQRPEFTEPEILRTNLASVILQMEVSKLGKVEDFPFVQSPDGRLINDGYRLLLELGAVDQKKKLTKTGRQLARFPIDPRFARMLLAAREENCLSEVVTIVSALSVQDPRERPMNKQQAADELHAEFNHEKTDFLSIVNMWEFCKVQGDRLSSNQFRKMCKQRFLSYMRIREWRDIRRQLQQTLKTIDAKENTKEASYDSVHRALLAGLLGNIAIKEDRNEYLSTRNRRVMLFPGSGVFGKGPKWIMASEISETTRLYARCVAGIDPLWVESAGEVLLKHSYFGATWQRKGAQVGALRKSTLYGLVVVEKRRVNYGPINPVESRQIFLREGLVEGNYNTQATFYKHNLKLIDEVVSLEDKSRRKDILIEPEELYRFYDEIIPEGIYSGLQFEKWRVKYEENSPRGLYLTKDYLLRDDDTDINQSDFPDQIEFTGLVLPLKYHFRPGASDDGVTLVVPASLLNRVDAKKCQWLVPGMLEEKVIAMIKSLPKQVRRNFVPAPDYAMQSIPMMQPEVNHALTDALSSVLQKLTGVHVQSTDWQTDQLPVHLLMRYEVLDSAGQSIDDGRDIEQLQAKYLDQIEESLASNESNSFERTDLTDWNFGDLPEWVEVNTQGVQMKGYPALVDEDGTVCLRLFATPDAAFGAMHNGLRALYKKRLLKELKYLIRNLPGIDVLCLRFASVGKSDVLKHDIVDASVDIALINDRSYPRTREEFNENIDQHKNDLVTQANTICEQLARAFEMHRQVSRRMSGSVSLSWVEAIADIKDQISHLIYPGFVVETPIERLHRLPVYFKAIDKRLDGLDREPDRDRRRRAEIIPVWERIKEMKSNPAIWRMRWLMEELRVSVYAQELGTADKVSVGRIETLLQK